MNSSAPDMESQHKYIHLVIKNKKVNIIKNFTKFLSKPFSLDDAKAAAAEFWAYGQRGGVGGALQGMGDMENFRSTSSSC